MGFGFGPEGDLILLCDAVVFGFSIASCMLALSLITSKAITIIGDLCDNT